MDCSPPGSSVHGILQARILEWFAISFSNCLLFMCEPGLGTFGELYVNISMSFSCMSLCLKMYMAVLSTLTGRTEFSKLYENLFSRL